MDYVEAALFADPSCCAEQYLQSPLQLEHSCDLLLASELLTFHSERMCELLLDDAQAVSATMCLPGTVLRGHAEYQPTLSTYSLQHSS